MGGEPIDALADDEVRTLVAREIVVNLTRPGSLPTGTAVRPPRID